MQKKMLLVLLILILSSFSFNEVESIDVHEETTGFTYGSIENDTHTSITEHIYYVYNDSFINSFSASTNYGTDSNIAVYFAHLPTPPGPQYKYGLVVANLSDIPSTNTTITNSYLYLRSNSYQAGAVDDQYIYRITSAWTELGVNWNNKPTYDNVATDVIDYLDYGFWRYWNVTDDVQAFVNSTHTNYGWYIRCQWWGDTVNPNYNSRETTYDPYVSVYYETRFNVSRDISGSTEWDNTSFISDQVWTDNVTLKIPVSDNVSSILSVTNNTGGGTATEVNSKDGLVNDTFWFDSANHFVYIRTMDLGVGTVVNWTVLSTPPWHFYIQIPQYKEVGEDIIMSGRISNVTDCRANVTARTHVYYQNGTDALSPIHYWWCDNGNYFCSIATSSLPPGIYLISIEVTDSATGFIHKKGAILYLSWEAGAGIYNNAVVYINWYNTNIGLGLPDETLKLYVDGVYKNNNIVYTYIGAELEIIVQDYYDLEMYNGTYNVTIPADEINLGLTFHEYYFTNTNNEFYYVSLLKEGATRWFELVVPGNLGDVRFMLPSGNYTARVYNSDNSSYVSWDETVNRSKAYQIGNNGISLIIQGQSVIRGQLIEFDNALDAALMPDATIICRNPPIYISVFDILGMQLGGSYWRVCPPLNVLAETRNHSTGNWINSTPLVPSNGTTENGTITIIGEHDVIYITTVNGTVPSWINITYSDNGTLIQNTTWVPSKFYPEGFNVTINASDDVHIYRETVFNMLKKFDWDIYNGSNNPGWITENGQKRPGYHRAGIEIMNTMNVHWYNVYAYCGFSPTSKPDTSTVRITDVDNDNTILKDGENYDVTASAIQFKVLGGVNASETRNYLLEYYNSKLEQYYYGSDTISISSYQSNIRFNDKLYNYIKYTWVNRYDKTYRGSLDFYFKFPIPTEIIGDELVVYDANNACNVSDISFSGSSLKIGTNAIGDVASGSGRTYEIYFKFADYPGENPNELHFSTPIYIFLGVPISFFTIFVGIGLGLMIIGIGMYVYYRDIKKYQKISKNLMGIGLLLAIIIWLITALGV